MSEPITLGIVGTGLIGGSIGLRSRELRWQTIGFDVNPGATEEAKTRGAIDEAVAREILYERADTVVIATPLRAAIAEIEAIGVHKPRATLIVDVASVKEPVAQAARGLGNFVATHPLAGSERSGAAAAHAKLFTGKAWVYVPPGDQALETRVLDFIAAMGARAVPADAATHDAILALTSHVPQLLATLFGKTLRQQKSRRSNHFAGRLQWNSCALEIRTSKCGARFLHITTTILQNRLAS